MNENDIHFNYNMRFFKHFKKLIQIKNQPQRVIFYKNPILWTLKRNKFQNNTKFHRSGRKYESCVIYCFHSTLVYISLLEFDKNDSFKKYLNRQ